MNVTVWCRYRDGAELRPGEGAWLEASREQGGVRARLRLTRVQLRDAATIEVMAENSEGRVSISAPLRVKGNDLDF